MFGISYSRKEFSMKTLAAYVRGLIVISLLFFAFNQVTDAFENIEQRKIDDAPASDYFLYYQVEPFKRTVNQYEDIKMISFLDVYRPLDFQWNDVLYCDYDRENAASGFVNIASVDNTHTGVEPGVSIKSPWNWGGAKPDSSAKCYIESNITAVIEDGRAQKFQRIISDDFKIKYEQ